MLRFSKSLKHYVTDLSCVKRKQSMERLKKKGRFASMKQIKRSETLRQSQKKKRCESKQHGESILFFHLVQH